jgi:hypothetical protein
MACARGCCATQREHYQSLTVRGVDQSSLTKTTTDEHDTHSVDVTEHWHDRQDVTVKPPTHRLRLTQGA